MKVILVSYHYLPEVTPRAFRASVLYKTLKEQGHDVELVVPKFNREVKGNSRLKKHSSLRSSLRRCLEKILPGGKDLKVLPYFFSSLKNKNADLVLSIGLPFSVHLSVSLAKRFGSLNASSIIFDYGDPYSLNPNGNVCFYAKTLEKWALKYCDCVLTPVSEAVPLFSQLVNSEYPRIAVVPQCYDLENNEIEKYEKNSVPTFFYAGILYRGIREPLAFLKYLSEIESDYRFIVYTNTESSENLSILSAYEKGFKGRMIIKSLIPREDCIKELSKADFLINFSNEDGVQQPSKLVDYTLSGRPYLSIGNNQKDFSQFKSYFSGDYSDFLPIDISRFDRREVTKKIINLAREVKDT